VTPPRHREQLKPDSNWSSAVPATCTTLASFTPFPLRRSSICGSVPECAAPS